MRIAFVLPMFRRKRVICPAQGESMKHTTPILALGAALALSACAVPGPTGPSVIALPGKGADYAIFQQQDGACRQNASASIGGASPQIAANQAAAGTLALSTVGGAALGALIGAAAGNVGAGAAIGAASGALLGSGAAANQAGSGGFGLQRQYDITYAQCMTAAGNEVQGGVDLAAGPGYFAPPVVFAPPPLVYGGGVFLGIGPRWGGHRGYHNRGYYNRGYYDRGFRRW